MVLRHLRGEGLMWFLYVVMCSDGTLYCGITMDVARRVQEHNESTRGAKYTRTRRPVTLYGFREAGATRAEAMRAELAFKRLSRSQKTQEVMTW